MCIKIYSYELNQLKIYPLYDLYHREGNNHIRKSNILIFLDIDRVGYIYLYRQPIYTSYASNIKYQRYLVNLT